MRFFKVERNAALVLAIAAILGLTLANIGGIEAIDRVKSWVPLGLPISLPLESWIYEFGLPAFFFLVGLELKRELTGGQLSPARKIVVPALAAILGVCVPALAYLAVVGPTSEAAGGWAIPTATDVTFALAVFIAFGRPLPQSARTFLLAYAVIDDVIAVVIVSFLFTGSVSILTFVWVILALSAFAVVNRSKVLSTIFGIWVAWQVLIAFGAIYAAISGGLQPTLIGLALGLLIRGQHTRKLEDALHPWISFGVLPVFAFFAAAVHFGNLSTVATDVVFFAVLIRPIGKFLGIWLGAELGKKLLGGVAGLPTKTLIPVSLLGGIGFTVALLVAKYSFVDSPEHEVSAVAATLLATAITALLAAQLLSRHSSKSANRA